jgi:Malectin domain
MKIYFTEVGQRVFNIRVEERDFTDIDIIELAGGPDRAMTLDTAQVRCR